MDTPQLQKGATESFNRLGVKVSPVNDNLTNPKPIAFYREVYLKFTGIILSCSFSKMINLAIVSLKYKQCLKREMTPVLFF